MAENKAVELTTVDLDAKNSDLPSIQSKDYIKVDLNNDITDAEESLDRLRSNTYSPYVPDNSPTVLTFENITVKTKAEPVVTLLHSISGQISGGFYAIMGASGSGKTTLLSTLSLRLDTRHMEVDGKIRLNGREYTRTILKSMSAYVMQDDVLHAELTVSETLSYAAELRLPPTITKEERINRVEEVTLMMGIGHIGHVIVGDSRKKGISGGERKRLCIAIELLTKPKLIFLDEPTSGLDSTTALSVCETLQSLSSQGSCQKSMFFLETIGLPCPPGVNPADHLLDVISPNRRESTATKVDEHGKKTVPVNLSLGHEKGAFSTATQRSWISQYEILCRRNFMQYMRRKDIIAFNVVTTVVLSCFVSLGIWRNIGTTQVSVNTRVPSLFFACVTQGILSSLQTINSFPKERAVMLRERAADTYAATSLATAVSTICVSIDLSTVILSVLFEISRLYGGYFTSPEQLLSYPNWKFADALSYIKYSFVGVALNELEGLVLTCTAAQVKKNACTRTGEVIMAQKGYDQYTIGFCAGILAVYIVGCRIIGYLGLRFIKV
eukprot:gene21369-27686_t